MTIYEHIRTVCEHIRTMYDLTTHIYGLHKIIHILSMTSYIPYLNMYINSLSIIIHMHILEQLSKLCVNTKSNRDHQHADLQGGVAKYAAVYPYKLCLSIHRKASKPCVSMICLLEYNQMLLRVMECH